MANSYRIKVDLSEFFDDCRKESYIFVKQEWNSIKSIQSHIAELFNLSKNPNPTLITGDGVFLPPEESIQILTRYDSIKVRRNSPVILPKASYREPKLSSNSTLLDHCNLPALFHTNETPIVPIEILKKRNGTQSGSLLKKSKLSISFDTRLDDANHKHHDHSEDEVDGEEEDMEVTTPNISQKKKRRRIRKRKCKASVITPTEKKKPTGKPNGKAGTTETINSKPKNDSKNQHTKFNSGESSESSSSEEDEEPLEVSARFRAVDLPLNVSRIIKGIRTSCPVALVEAAVTNGKTIEKTNGHSDPTGEVIDCSTLAHIEDSDLADEEEESHDVEGTSTS